MIALWIILAILAFLLLVILFGTVKVRILYRERVKLKVGLWCFSYTLISDKQKKEKEPKKFEKCKNPEKVLQKEQRRREKEAERAERRLAKKAEKKKKKARKKAELKKADKEEELTSSPYPRLKQSQS